MPDDLKLVESWSDFMRYSRGRSEATTGKYAGYLRRLADWMASRGQGLLEADQDALEQFTGLHMHREGLSPRSRRALVAAIRQFYAWTVRARYLVRNPAGDLPYPKAGLRLPVAMQLRHAEALLMQPDIETFTGIRDAALISVLIGCGLRISGAVGLNESDLVWMEVEGQEWLVLKTREKGDRQRLVPAPPEARLMIRAYLGHQDLEDIDRNLPNGDRVLFVSTRNRNVPEHEYRGEARRFSVRSAQEMIVQRGQAAGIPRDELHPHAMRHLYGTEFAEDDVDLLQRQALMGHSSASSTQIYTHLAIRKLTSVVRTSNPLGKMRTPVTDLLRHIEDHL